MKKIIVILVSTIMMVGCTQIDGVKDDIPLDQSINFVQSEIVKETGNFINNIENKEYKEIQKNCTNEMKKEFDNTKNNKIELLSELGKQMNIITEKYYESNETGETLAMAELTIEYEKGKVDYTIAFDKDMKLAGLIFQIK